jgi:hypothetical protein
MITWNPFKLLRYRRAWNRLKEIDMEGIKKWNSRKLVVALVTASLLWLSSEADLGLKEGDVAPLATTIAEYVLKALGGIVGIVFMIVQGRVDREEKKNGSK